MDDQFYAACYYYDSAPKYNNNNPNLMFQAPLRNNWFWSIDSGFHDFFPKYTKLTGQLIDGIFIENELTKEEFEIRAQKSISEGRPLYPSKPSYQLFEYTAIKGYLNSLYAYPMHSDSNFPRSIENLTDIFFYEYPIHFVKSENKSRIKKMMIFGDSLSDNGNLKLWLKVMPEFPYWFGRFTDGITWSEYLRKSANITMSNWAIGGAKSGNINDFNAEEIIEYVKTEGRNFITGSVSTTIDRYLQNCLTNGSTIDQKTTEDTIYVIWIGANDYLEKFDDTNTFLRLIDHPNETGGYEEVSSRAVENIVATIKKLRLNRCFGEVKERKKLVIL